MELIAQPIPRLRGVFHAVSCPVFLTTGVVGVFAAQSIAAAMAIIMFTLGIAGMFGTSAAFHMRKWSPRAHLIMRKADHTMIFIAMASSYTAVWMVVLGGPISTAMVMVAWAGAFIGTILKFKYIDVNKLVHGFGYSIFGLIGILALPEIIATTSVTFVAALIIGGVFYLLGSAVYMFERPNPIPHLLGYHEIFHICTIFGASIHAGALLSLAL